MDDKDSKLFCKYMMARGYEMGKYLGKGRTGVVYKAWNPKDLNHVAVKVIVKKKVTDKYYTENLPLEISVWQQMRHSNIIRLLDHTSNTKWTFTVMEYSPGDLQNWLLCHDWVEDDLGRRWVRQLTCALHYLKKLGYAHGDVKPKNILVVRNKSIKLCDFGCMKPLNEGLCEVYWGSPGYIAPEVFKKEPHDSEKADVWSYGVTGFNLLTHGMITKDEKVRYVTTFKKNWNKILPLEAQSLFKGVLKKRPEKRLNFDEILHHPWICTFPNDPPSDLPTDFPTDLPTDLSSTQSTSQLHNSPTEDAVHDLTDDDCSVHKKGPAKLRKR